MSSNSGFRMEMQWETENSMKGAENEITPDDNKALRMMRLMGFTPGLGLGKNKQGIKSPIKLTNQLGKRGLGLNLNNLEHSNETWDSTLEKTQVQEEIEWLQNTADSFPYTAKDLKDWTVEGSPINDATQQHNFCDKEILAKVLNGKDIFNQLDNKELSTARSRANPFETIRSVFFMNRAALKMANIDAATGFMFTNIDRDVNHKGQGPFYFADVCAGPGGFTEYILWRKKWAFKGFGFTLRGDNDFKVVDSMCASPETFLALYGAKGDGNICCPENIKDFKVKILHETKNQGVHFMASDGGFSVEGNEDLQEILSKNIYVCQCLTALEILRTNGHFVTKLFDIFTNFSAGLLYLMYKCFEKVCILKPNSSRPANSERYFICCNLKNEPYVAQVKKYLHLVVNRLWEIMDDSGLDILEIVPLNIIKNDKDFFDFLYSSNNRIAERQTVHLNKLAVFCRNPLLVDTRQENLRKECLQFWQIPDKPKVYLPKLSIEDVISSIVLKKELFLAAPREISNPSDFQTLFSDISDWKYTFMQSCKKVPACSFFVGLGMSRVYRLQNNKWVKMKNMYLVRGTLLFGEFVKETCESAQESFKYSLHVIDALKLGDVSLGDFSFDERMELISNYCRAVNHEFRINAVRIRPKVINSLGSFSDNQLSVGRNICDLPPMGFNKICKNYEVESILFLKTNENQSFYSTYILRTHLFLTEDWEPIEALMSFISSKAKPNT